MLKSDDTVPLEAVGGQVNEPSVPDDSELHRIRTKVAELQAKVEELEDEATLVKTRADEAHDLADEAEEAARAACKPYGYQPGCGNDE